MSFVVIGCPQSVPVYLGDPPAVAKDKFSLWRCPLLPGRLLPSVSLGLSSPTALEGPVQLQGTLVLLCGHATHPDLLAFAPAHVWKHRPVGICVSDS